MTLHKRQSLTLYVKHGEKTAYLDFGMEFLQVLHDRAINCATKVGMMIRNHAGLVPNIIENILEASLAKELVPRAEGDLDDAAELGEFPGGVVLDVRDAFKVRCSSAGSDPSGASRGQGETRTPDAQTSCLTIAFQATKRSMMMSLGRRSWFSMFFLMSVWVRDIVDRREREERTEVARERLSWSLL
jgi:hypothetical protein